MGANGTAVAPLEGVVRSVNDKGVRLDGETDWRNFSKFAQPGDIAAVTAGTPVLVSLDKSGFIRQLVPLGTASAQHANPTPSAVTPVASTTAANGTSTTTAAPTSVDNSVRIGRQACINSANSYLQHNQRVYTVEELLALAGQLEAWVNR